MKMEEEILCPTCKQIRAEIEELRVEICRNIENQSAISDRLWKITHIKRVESKLT